MVQKSLFLFHFCLTHSLSQITSCVKRKREILTQRTKRTINHDGEACKRVPNLYHHSVLMPDGVRGSNVQKALVKLFDSVLAGMQACQSECSQSAYLGCFPSGEKMKMVLCTDATIGRRMHCSKDFAQFS